MSELIKALEDYRALNNLNWGEVAKNIGVSSSAITLWLQEERAPDLDSVRKMLKIPQLRPAVLEYLRKNGGE